MKLDGEFRLLVRSFLGDRHIAVSDIGDKNSKNILLCLPGILEIKSTFNPLSPLIQQGYRIISLDYCGRGNSDYLKNYNNYQISTYIEDVLAVCEYITDSNKRSNPILQKFNFNVWRLQGRSIHLLGSSMGGLIAAQIATSNLSGIKSLILNDISSLIPWSGLYSLYGHLSHGTFNISNYGNFSNSSELAKKLGVDPNLLKAVMKPSHLNIQFNNTINGIEFRSIFSSLTIPICLIYSLDSKLVNTIAITNIKKYSEDIKFIGVEGSNHPVKLDNNIIKKIISFISQINHL